MIRESQGRVYGHRLDSVFDNVGLCLRRFFRGLLSHGRLKAANTVTNSFAQLRKLPGAEHEQGNSEDYQQMHRLEQSFKHNSSANSRCARYPQETETPET